MRAIPIRLTVLLLVLGAPISHSFAQEPRAFTADKFLFKGRLLAVGIAHDNALKQDVLSLQFIVDAPYALMPTAARETAAPIARVWTNWPAADLTSLRPENYVQMMESMLPNDIRLGQQCLVVANWPGAHGLEIVSIEAAAAAAEGAFLAEHKEYIYGYRAFSHQVRLRASRGRLEMMARDLATFEAEAASVKGDSLEAWTETLAQKRAQLVAEREATIARIRAEIASLGRERDTSVDALERETLEGMMRDSALAIEAIERQENP